MSEQFTQQSGITLEERIQQSERERDDLLDKEAENGKLIQKLREREKNGEDVSEEIKKLKEEIREMEYDLDGAYKKVNRLKKDLAERGPIEVHEQKVADKETGEVKKETSIEEEKLSEKSKVEDQTEEEKKKFEESFLDMQKRFAFEMGQVLSLLRAREDRKFSTSIIPRESLNGLDNAKRALESKELNMAGISRALDDMNNIFQQESKESRDMQIIEDSKSLEDFINSAIKVKYALENYKQVVLEGKDKNPEYEPLIGKINNLKDTVEAKKIRATISKQMLGNYIST